MMGLVPLKEETWEFPFSLSVPCEDREKVAACKSYQNLAVPAPALGLPASRTVEGQMSFL